MKNQILFLLFCLFILFSCGPNFDSYKEYHYLNEEVKKWWVPDSAQSNFDMVCSDSSVVTFSRIFNDTTFSYIKMGLGFMENEKYVEESFNQSFKTSIGQDFYIYMQPAQPNRGNTINFWLYNTEFIYDADNKIITSVMTGHGWEWLHSSPDGQQAFLNSSAEILDSISIQNKLYENVLLLKINDLQSYWDSITIREFYYAQKIGLVKYILNNNKVYERVW